MNEYDSFRIENLLQAKGFRRTYFPRRASLILINSCTVREKAENKAFSALGTYLEIKKLAPNIVIGFGGCVPALDQKRELVAKRFAGVDFLFKPSEVDRIPELIEPFENRLSQPSRLLDVEEMLGGALSRVPVASFLTAQIGCNRACSYCVIPKARGREISRPVQAVLEEARRLVDSGAREITLLGQVIDAYHGIDDTGKESDLAQLCRRLSQIENLRRIRFITSHPNHLKPEIVNAFEELPKLCPYLHLPFQAGSDRILKQMRRGYNRAAYLEKVDEIRTRIPDLALSADCIIGFPGETEAEFMESVELIQQVKFDQIYSFIYSKRPGTPSSCLEDPVPIAEKKNRLAHFQNVQRSISLGRNQALVGRTAAILVEGQSKTRKDRMFGRTRSNKVVTFGLTKNEDMADVIGKELPIRIIAASANALRGERND